MKLFTQNPSCTFHSASPITMPRTLLLLPPLRLHPSGVMASPQLGLSGLSSCVKSVVAPGGLTRYKTGDGSCNREIRVVLGTVRMRASAHCADAFSNVSFSVFYRTGVRRLRPVRRQRTLCGIRIKSFGTLFVSAPLCGDSEGEVVEL